MVLFKLRLWLLRGPNLIAVAVYPLRGWCTLFVWCLSRNAFPLVLPVRAREWR